MNLTDWMPTGPRALAYRKLQNEVQMVWFTHPANAARTARRLPPVNAFWPWARTEVPQTTTADSKTVVPAQAGTQFPKQEPGNLQAIVSFETPGWLTALGTRKLPALSEITTGLRENTLLICGNVSAPAIAADWSSWLQQMQRLETELFSPALAALKNGAIRELRLVLSHRGAHAEYTTTALAQRKFWRRPTLDRLI
jgi:hypothetical protein